MPFCARTAPEWCTGSLGLMPLPACAHAILRNTTMVRLHPRVNEPQLLVDRAYLLAHERGQAGKQRAIFQRAQLPWLGVDVRLVTGYDGQELRPWHRECMFASSHPANNATHPQQPMYVSQVLKMWAAFYDMRRHASAIRLALIMEDDVVVHFGRLPALNIVLRTLAACPHAKTILHLSTYSPIGHSFPEPCGLSRAPPTPRLWSGVANIVTTDVARYFLEEVIPPDASASDKVLSVRGSAHHGPTMTPAPVEFAVKPFPFTAGDYSGTSVFRCGMELGCERRWYRKWTDGARSDYSTWIATRLAHADAGGGEAAAARLQPLTHGCPELHDCTRPAGRLRGIENLRNGAKCLTDRKGRLIAAQSLDRCEHNTSGDQVHASSQN